MGSNVPPVFHILGIYICMSIMQNSRSLKKPASYSRFSPGRGRFCRFDGHSSTICELSQSLGHIEIKAEAGIRRCDDLVSFPPTK